MNQELVISGETAPGFEGVRYEFINNFLNHHEMGAAVTVVRGNEVLVDLWGGWLSKHKQQTWEPDTIVNVWSTTKGLVALAAHMLIDRGMLDLEDRISKHWPEFAQAGKDEITVRQLLGHRSGLAGWRRQVNYDEIHDWDLLCGSLAAQKPLWQPGTASGYHALTFGHLVGELVRRVDGRTIDVFIREEISDPLRLHSVSGDFIVGTQPEDDIRTAQLWVIPDETFGQNPNIPGRDTAEPRLETQAEQDLMATAMSTPLITPRVASSTEWRRGVFPAANGHGSAQAVATMYAALAANGSVDGLDLISQAGVETMRQAQPAGKDLVLQDLTGHMTWGLGYMLNTHKWHGPNADAFYHGGYGGSLGFADPEANFGFGYVMNALNIASMGKDTRSINLLNAVYEGFELMPSSN